MRRSGTGGEFWISGGSPTAIPEPPDWAVDTAYALDQVVKVTTGGSSVQALCVLGHTSGSQTAALTVASGELTGADSDNWRLVQDGSITALTNWSYDTNTETTDRSYVVTGSRQVGDTTTTTGSITFSDDDESGFDAAQRGIVVGNTVTAKLRPKGTGTGRPEYTGSVRFTQETGAYSDEEQERTFNFTVNGAWTRSYQA